MKEDTEKLVSEDVSPKNKNSLKKEKSRGRTQYSTCNCLFCRGAYYLLEKESVTTLPEVQLVGLPPNFRLPVKVVTEAIREARIKRGY